MLCKDRLLSLVWRLWTKTVGEDPSKRQVSSSPPYLFSAI